MKDLAKMAKALSDSFDELAEQQQQIDARIAKSAAAISAKPIPKFVFEGLTGAYMSVIKQSNGLTSARPASLKAIQNAEKSPSESTIRVAVAEMKKHIAELEKTAKTQKEYPGFKSRMEAVIKKTEALLG